LQPIKRIMRRKNKVEKTLWLLVLVSLGGVVLYIFLHQRWEREDESKVKFVHFSAFGIDIPTGYSIHGIDVSSHQELISWPAVKSMNINNTRLGFAFIKATEGLNDTDKRFKQNWDRAKRAGMVCGAYHFFLATKSGGEQAQNFIEQVTLEKGDLPPVLDIEQLYGVKPELMRSRIREWLIAVEKQYGVKPIIYSYADFYERNLGREFDGYPLWVAHYFEPLSPRVSRPWTFWQHSDGGHVNGVNSAVDFNVFNGDSAEWKKIIMK